jgi:hypothetical protein
MRAKSNSYEDAEAHCHILLAAGRSEIFSLSEYGSLGILLPHKRVGLLPGVKK